jgi:replicative DNA helicase
MRELRDSLLSAAALAENGDAGAVLCALANVDVGEYTQNTVMNAGQLAERAIERFAAPDEQRISLGLPRLSNAVGYMPAGGVLVVAGATGVGKSGFTLELLLAAAKQGVGSGMISLEDSEEIAGGRLLSMESGVSARLLQRGIADSSGWHHVNQAYAQAQRVAERFLFANCIGGTEIDVCACMTKMARRGAKLIAVDYIGEIQASQAMQDRRNELRWMMTRLKQHALRLGVALVVVSQLKRPPPTVKFWKPSKHDLKESGDLENKAEVVVLLWREEENDFAPLHVEVAKCKWGGTGQSWTMQREQEGGSARLLETA